MAGRLSCSEEQVSVISACNCRFSVFAEYGIEPFGHELALSPPAFDSQQLQLLGNLWSVIGQDANFASAAFRHTLRTALLGRRVYAHLSRPAFEKLEHTCAVILHNVALPVFTVRRFGLAVAPLLSTVHNAEISSAAPLAGAVSVTPLPREMALAKCG